MSRHTMQKRAAIIVLALLLTGFFPLSARAAFDDNDSWGRDPFAGEELPPAAVETDYKTGTAFWLSGIFIRQGTRSAIVNRMLVKTGDEVLGARVTQIGDDKVVLKKDGEEITLSLGARR